MEAMSEDVFVVIGTRGEYSDRYEWVAGVFTSKAEAIRLATEKLAESRAADAIFDDWCRCKRTVTGSFLPELRYLPDADRDKEVLTRCGPAPQGGDADDYTVVKVPLNSWGRWEECK